MRAWIPALVLALPVMVGAAEFENPKTGYTVSVPERFQHRYEAKSDTLWIAARGGMRIRVETRDHSGDLDGRAAGSWYKRDGMALKSSSDKFQVLRKPVLDKSFGKDHPGFMYAFAFTPGPSRALAYLSDGSSEIPGKRLQIRVLAYGPPRALQGHEEDLSMMLASFGWPSAEPPPVDPDDGTQVAVVSPGTPSGGTIVVAPEPGRGSDGLNPSTTYKPTGDFSRGSLSGGYGAMGNAGVISDSRLKKALDARRSGLGAQRDEATKSRASGYLGFKKTVK